MCATILERERRCDLWNATVDDDEETKQRVSWNKERKQSARKHRQIAHESLRSMTGPVKLRPYGTSQIKKWHSKLQTKSCETKQTQEIHTSGGKTLKTAARKSSMSRCASPLQCTHAHPLITYTAVSCIIVYVFHIAVKMSKAQCMSQGPTTAK